MPFDKPKNLFKLYSKDKTLLHVTKSPQLQGAVDKSWWPDVHHIIVEHYNSFDEMEYAKAVAVENVGKERITKSVITMFPGNDGE